MEYFLMFFFVSYTIGIFCDPIDTVQSICDQHPALQKLKGVLTITCLHHDNRLLRRVVLEAHDSPLQVDCTCWTLVFKVNCSDSSLDGVPTLKHVHDSDSETDFMK